MIADLQDAYRQLLGTVSAAWATTGHPIFYPNTVEKLPSAVTPWARVQVLPTKSEQRTISRPGQIYTSNGVLIIQVFTPPGDGISSTLQTSLVKILTDALRGQQTLGGLFFMEVTSQPIGMSGAWFQTNVACRWQYDERLNG